MELASPSASQPESIDKKKVIMKKVKSSKNCAMNAMALARFFRANVLCKQKVKVTIKLAVSADIALKRHGDRHTTRAESSESELN